MTSRAIDVKHCGMKSFLQTQKIIFSLFIAAFSAQSLSAEESKTLTLSKEDARGSNALLAVVRNIDKTKKVLADDTRILVKVSKNATREKLLSDSVEPLSKGAEEKGRVYTKQSITTVSYILLENKNKVIQVDEVRVDVTRMQRIKDESSERVKLKALSATTDFSYSAGVVDDSNKIAYLDAFEALWEKDAAESVVIDGGDTVYRLSDIATRLIIKASQAAKALSEEMAKIKASKLGIVLDTTSPKTVTYNLGGDIELIGFVRDSEENLEAPDAVSAWTVKISRDAKVTVSERKADASPKIESLIFE